MSVLDHFSKVNPKLQVAWDSTSLKLLMECPRRYQYEIMEGWRGSKIDLEFGIFFANAMETFYKSRLAGSSIEDAMFAATKRAVQDTFSKKTKRVWGGEYATVWHCTGMTKYKNAKGNAAKCPYAHKGEHYPGPHPSTCGECGSKIEEERLYVPTSKKKNRITLIRAVVWYCLDQPETGGFQPYAFPDGTPAVELPFRVALPMAFKTGDIPILCGYFDRFALFAEQIFPTDNKTTNASLGTRYFDGFSPNVQFDTYDMAASMLFPDLPIRGVYNDAVQMNVESVQFGKMEYYKTEALRQEHLEFIEYWLRQAEQYAEADFWPMNKSACWHCPFNRICSKDPAVRQRYLEADMDLKKQERWNPLKER